MKPIISKIDQSKPLEESLSFFLYDHMRQKGIETDIIEPNYMLDEIYYDLVCEVDKYIEFIQKEVAKKVAEEI